MAELLVEQERLEEACNRLEKAYRSHPDDAGLGETLAWCLVQRGNELFDVDDPGVSLELFRHALDLNPVNRGIWDSILAAYAAIGMPAEGENLLQKRAEMVIGAFGIKEYEKLKAYVYSEEARLAVNGIDRAQQEELFRKAVALDPDYPVYVTKLARIIQRSGHYEESLNLLKKQRGRCRDDICRATIDESLQKELLLERLVRKLD
jgi:tetratricopeptide (TPR) repeat protein